MKKSHLDLMVEDPDQADYNIIFMGADVFDRLQMELEHDLKDILTHKKEIAKLLMPAMEYRGLFLVRSPVVPDNQVIACHQDAATLQQTKELIGWID